MTFGCRIGRKCTLTTPLSDADANTHDSDSAMMDVTIRVHRDVTLDYYMVGDDKMGSLGMESMTYKSDGVFSHTEIDGYIYNAPYSAEASDVHGGCQGQASDFD